MLWQHGQDNAWGFKRRFLGWGTWGQRTAFYLRSNSDLLINKAKGIISLTLPVLYLNLIPVLRMATLPPQHYLKSSKLLLVLLEFVFPT